MGKLSFSDFVMSIAHGAYVSLGVVENPFTKKREINLEQARETIDLLDMIKTKTSGNLTEGEEKLLDEILYDLRMRFIKELNKSKKDTGGET